MKVGMESEDRRSIVWIAPAVPNGDTDTHESLCPHWQARRSNHHQLRRVVTMYEGLSSDEHDGVWLR